MRVKDTINMCLNLAHIGDDLCLKLNAYLFAKLLHRFIYPEVSCGRGDIFTKLITLALKAE